MGYDVVESGVKDRDKFRQCRMVAVVSGVHPHMMPNRLDGVEFRAIGRERTKMKAMPIAGQPLPHHRSTVIGRVVMDKKDLLPPIPFGQAGQKGRVGFSFEDLSVRKVKFGPVKIHRAKNLLRVPLAGGRNQRLVSAPRPSLVKAGVLPEAGFVAKQQGRFAFSGFFLAGDRCSAATGPVPPGLL
jgi:hypothetical protein